MLTTVVTLLVAAVSRDCEMVAVVVPVLMMEVTAAALSVVAGKHLSRGR